ncbi:menaquinone biosynthesis protein [Nocardia sp. NPDC050710]|uniref:menaquinone biosynthetic enzyme MqnA/MqnD family protein n=1 Tax=Nocardia sp. NPDC050710 TaxID=3157220 RepID=UPI00340EFC0A
MGHIEFLNYLPILWGLARTGSLIDLDLVRDTPENLSDALTSGQIDIGPISLMEFLGHADELVMLPDIAIGCDGPVMSCLLVSRVPLEELDGAPIGLSSHSRTSVRLAQLLLSDFVGVEPRYFVSGPEPKAMLATAPAAVLIGDAALRVAVFDAPSLGLTVHDLGQMWREWTGFPFVFAVLAARREFVEREPEIVRQVHADLLAARDLATSEMDQLCARIAQWAGFDTETLRHYYTTALDFSLGVRQQAGIAEFAARVGGARAGFPPDVRTRLLDTA